MCNSSSSIPPQPFQVGDRVVCLIGAGSNGYLQTGHTYTVRSIWYCCSRFGWRIHLEEVFYVSGHCVHCNRNYNECGWLTGRFTRPEEVSAHTAESLLEELEPVLAHTT